MRRRTVLITLLLLTATACTDDYHVYMFGSAIRPNVRTVLLTRDGTTVTKENLQKFKMLAISGSYIDHTISDTEPVMPADGIYFNSYVKKVDGNWDIYDNESDTAPVEKYWINSSPMSFWSYYPYDSGLNGSLSITAPAAGASMISFNYTQPSHVDGSDASRQQDIVFAGNVETREFNEKSGVIEDHTSTNSDYNRNDNQLDIVFHHPLSKIMFGVSATDNTFNKGLVIKNIELIDIFSTGVCTFTVPSDFQWDSRSTKKTYSQDFNADFSSCTGAAGAPDGWSYNSSNGLNVCDNVFFLIPQSTDGVKVKITFDFAGSTIYKTVSLPTSDTWCADHYYLYKIKAQGSSDGITLAVTLADWAERGYSILF